MAAKAMSPVFVQWDPDRSLQMDRLDVRAVQIGLSGDAVRRYISDWIEDNRDVTSLAI